MSCEILVSYFMLTGLKTIFNVNLLHDTFSSSGPQLTPRLDTHPAMITVLEMGAARHFLRTQQLARTAEERAQILQPTLEINAGWEMEGCVVGLISLDGIITFR